MSVLTDEQITQLKHCIATGTEADIYDDSRVNNLLDTIDHLRQERADAVQALLVARDIITGWTEDVEGRVTIHKDAIFKAVNAAIENLQGGESEMSGLERWDIANLPQHKLVFTQADLNNAVQAEREKWTKLYHEKSGTVLDMAAIIDKATQLAVAEARLAEAKWWAESYGRHTGMLGMPCDGPISCQVCKRIAQLRAAVDAANNLHF